MLFDRSKNFVKGLPLTTVKRIFTVAVLATQGATGEAVMNTVGRPASRASPWREWKISVIFSMPERHWGIRCSVRVDMILYLRGFAAKGRSYKTARFSLNA